MRLRDSAGEAFRNVTTGMTRPVTLIVMLSCVILACAGLDMRQVWGIEQQADAYRSSLSNAYFIKAEGQVDPRSCGSMRSGSAVQGAGALRKVDPLRFALAQNSPVNTYEVSPGFIDIVTGGTGSRGSGGGIWLSQNVAAKFGLSAGSLIETTTGRMRVAGVYPWQEDGRDTRLGYAALVETLETGTFDECWVALWPPHDVSMSLRRALVFSSHSSDAQVAQVNYTQGERFDPNTAFLTRVTRPLLLVPLPLCFITVFAFCRRRRLESAGCLHAGEPKASMVLRLLMEYGFCVLVAMLVAVPPVVITSCLTAGRKGAGGLLVVSLLPVLYFALLGVVAGALAGAVSIREKALFRSFKQRD